MVSASTQGRWALFCSVCAVLSAAGPPPKMPKGLPKGLGQGGPPWRKAIDKVFTEACQMNRGAPSVFCFPDKKELLAGLQVEQYGLDLTGEMFLMDVFVVIKQLLDWPPAWSDVADVLDPKEKWTVPYCDKIIGAPWWSAVPLVRKSFLSPRHTLVQLEKDSPHVAAGIHRWLEAIRKSGNSHTLSLIKDFKANDAADVKTRSVRARPLMRLMQQVHAKMVQHVFGTACKGSKVALDKLQKNDTNGLTVLHHVASLGDAAGAKAILKSLPKSRRRAFAGIQDVMGYTAEDWAGLGDFPDTVEAIRALSGSAKGEMPQPGSAPAVPSSLFPASRKGAIDSDQDDGSQQCSSSDPSSCGSADMGGWQTASSTALLASWMPAAEQPCSADTIDISQFDFDVFAHHYMLHPRPLLIKGGARLTAEATKNFTRAGLLAVAGDRKMDTHRWPTEREFDGTKPQVKTLQEYVEFLGERSEKTAASKLHYVYQRLAPEESYLNFSATLPDILADKVDHIGTQFFLGGALMGAPPRHHSPAVTSLVFGRKLWFLDPPGRELVVHEAMYDYLVRTGGAPGSARCVQEAGDLLYVPRSWTHSDVCLEDCIGMTHEITHNWWDLRD